MAGRYSCDNTWLECYDNQAAARDYLCRMKLKEFYSTGAYCLNSPENGRMGRSVSLDVIQLQEPKQESSESIESALISLGDSHSLLPPATGQAVGPWGRCIRLVRGLIGFKSYSTPLKFQTPASDGTFSTGSSGSTPTSRRW